MNIQIVFFSFHRVLYDAVQKERVQWDSLQSKDFTVRMQKGTKRRYAGVILAAGESVRMGRAKPLLPYGEMTFVARVTDQLLLAGCEPVVVVLGRNAPEIQSILPKDPRVIPLSNPHPEHGQISSLKRALSFLADSDRDAALVALADHPDVKMSTFQSLVDAGDGSGYSIVIPTYKGRGGHPFLLSRDVWQEMADTPMEGGARPVVRRDRSRVLRLEVDDPGIHTDVDTPDDYQCLLRGQTSALILAGGQGSRLGGVDKSGLVCEGEELLDRTVGVLGQVASEIILSVQGIPRRVPTGVRFIQDQYLGCGPLAGIHAGMQECSHPWVIVVACDMPHLSASLLSYLVEEAQGVDALVPMRRGRAEPLHAVYRREATISRVEKILERGGRRLMELLDEMEVRFLDEARWSSAIPEGGNSFRNLNTLEDLDESGIHVGF